MFPETVSMSKESKQWYVLTDKLLWMLISQDGYPGARAALDRVKEIQKLGHTAAIYWSEFNNAFSVFDESIPEQLRQSQTIRAKAKPFPSLG